MKTTTSKKLKDSHQSFILAYVANGMVNGTQAYLQAYPNSSNDTARANASKLLARTDIQQALDTYKDSQVVYTKRTRSQHRDKLEVIADRSLDEQQYATSLKAEQAIGKLDGLDDTSQDDGKASYHALIGGFIQSLAEAQDRKHALKKQEEQASLPPLSESNQVIDIEQGTDNSDST